MADNQADGAGTPLTEQAKQQAQQVVQQGQQMAGHVWDLARSQFRSQLNGQKERAATSLDDFAQMLHQTGSQLREQGQAGGSQYAERIADRIAHFSASVHQKDIDQLVADAENFARSRPAAFVGIAALTGFALARFLKSSGQGVTTAA